MNTDKSLVYLTAAGPKGGGGKANTLCNVVAC